MTDRDWAARAARLRETFDAGFAAPPRAERPPTCRLLLIALAGHPGAVPLDDCAAVKRASGLTVLPGRVPAFHGVATVGGTLLPLYDLATCLGDTPRAQARAWLLVSAGRHRVAFMVDGVDGYAEIDADGPSGLPPAVTIGGAVRRVIRLATVVDTLDQALHTTHGIKE